jgi:hypothetical protein
MHTPYECPERDSSTRYNGVSSLINSSQTPGKDSPPGINSLIDKFKEK